MKRIFVTISILLSAMTAFSQQIYNIKTSDTEDGRYEQYFGTIKVSGNVLNGMKDGSWVENHPNSDIPHFIIQYKEGKKDGLYLFGEDGKVTLGATDSAAVEWMKQSKNQKTLSLIRKDTYPEMFED